MSEPILELPETYTYGYVFGGVIRAQGDTSSDVDRFPQGIPASGTVIFDPIEKTRKSLDSPPRFVQHERVTCTLSKKTGLLMDAQSAEAAAANPSAPEEYGVWLVTGDYRVSFQLNSGSIEPFDITVTSLHTVEFPLYLSSAAPYTPPAGSAVTIMQVPPGVAGMVLGWSSTTGLTWVPGGSGGEGGAADWGMILNKPLYIGAGSTMAAARAAIGAAAPPNVMTQAEFDAITPVATQFYFIRRTA